MESRLDFGKHLTSLGLTGEGVEVGTLFGEYAECILATWPGVLNMVDPWIQQSNKVYRDGCNAVDFDEAFDRTKTRLLQYRDRARFWRMLSLDAVPHFKDGQLDWAYLDGNHSRDSVEADLVSWWSKIKSGGIMAGHDYYDNHSDYQNCGVKSAVDEFVSLHTLDLTITPQCTSWWITKP